MGGITLLGILTKVSRARPPVDLLWMKHSGGCGVRARSCWRLGDPVFADTGTNRLHEAVNSYDAVGSYKRTCGSGYRVGRLFRPAFFPIFRWLLYFGGLSLFGA